jgi:tetratricopeptide (TPR) repeat protein
MALTRGTRLGNYEILDPLGSGGMGEVYQARDTKLQREVAIKVLPERFAEDPAMLERFEREARAIAQLSHPNILAIHELETDRGITFAVMELLEGETLREAVTHGAISWQKTVETVASIADGLSAAHAKGITHRDLKPENLFLTAEGQVKILDFGLARVEATASPEAETERRTKPGTVMGTVGYMSPEQVRGEKADARSDIFSLGCVFYEMLTGEKAFVRETAAETMTAILKEAPPELAESGKPIPPELDRVVKHCLEKKPGQRFQSAHDLAFDVRAILTDSGAARASVVAPRRAGARLALGVVAALAVLALAAIFLWKRDERSQPLTDVEFERVVVAVFENQTGDGSLDSLGRIAADWVTQGLSQTGLMEVVPTMAVIHYSMGGTGDHGAAQDVSPVWTLAERTGAGIIVSGTYYGLGENLHFRAEVNDATHRKLLHALDAVTGTRDDPMTAIEALRQQVMGALVTHIKPTALGGLLSKPPSFEAYQEYIAGMDFFSVDYARAIRHFGRSAELDPTFVAPIMYMVGAFSNQGNYDEAESLVQRLNENRGGLTAFERNYVDYWIAYLRGDNAEALRTLRQMEKLAPGDYVINFLIGNVALRSNRPQETVDTYAKMNPTFWYSHVTGSWRFIILADAHHMLGDYEKELETIRLGDEYFPNLPSLRAQEARALSALGRTQEVESVIDDSLTLPSGGGTPGDILLEAAEELRAHGHQEDAKEMVSRAVDWYRSRPAEEAATERNRFGLARAAYLAEQWEEAQRLFRQLASEKPDDIDYKGYLGALAVRRGDPETPLRIAAELEGIDRPYVFGAHMYWRSCIAALLGDRELAVRLLRDAFAQGFRYDVSLHRDVNLEPLRDYPPFQELLRPKG